MKENERKMKREEEERDNWKRKNTVTERLIDFDLIQCRGLYSLTKCVKNQNNQYNKITLRSKWELHKMGVVWIKIKGGQISLCSEFCYDSENTRHSKNSNFRYAQ